MAIDLVAKVLLSRPTLAPNLNPLKGQVFISHILNIDNGIE